MVCCPLDQLDLVFEVLSLVFRALASLGQLVRLREHDIGESLGIFPFCECQLIVELGLDSPDLLVDFFQSRFEGPQGLLLTRDPSLNRRFDHLGLTSDLAKAVDHEGIEFLVN